MSGRAAREAVGAYRVPIQNVLSCFAKGRLSVSSYDPSVPGVLTFNAGKPTRLKGPSHLPFTCSQNYEIVASGDVTRPWKVHTTKYIYRLIGQNDAGIVDYHWHPDNRADKAFPHLHATQYGCKLHHPTGRVLIEDLLLLSVECGAIPLDEAKWLRISRKNLRDFAKGATWGIPKL
jgi:hypothetical protein